VFLNLSTSPMPAQHVHLLRDSDHGRIARGGHGLPKVSPGPAMAYPSTPCGRATSETGLQPFQGWPSRRVAGLQPSSSLLDPPTPCAYDFDPDIEVTVLRLVTLEKPTFFAPILHVWSDLVRNISTRARPRILSHLSKSMVIFHVNYYSPLLSVRKRI
jgi:hypothetical protein